ncbi:PEP-CTERM sorting domain-containing protein [Pelomonas sp. SE-A7]|uniref:PEP-CTERM sorting domain-containing protein n=1 Tax=Pelomonas sp. SE-A7 TaxID=3054953 RepID=UPI00259CEE01|nr:PEP-CTERM sorting domain-containing protein [Pelomonas sp. SE-A7]MDM4766619.1 PEP-CTERM sorting domain-containing protein [Pelomonas sp. SE-A7]
MTAKVVFDLNSQISGTTWKQPANFTDLVSAVTVNDLDLVTISISFLPGQALRWNGQGSIEAWLGVDTVSSFGTSQGSLTFTGLQSGPAWSAAIADSSSCCAHLGITQRLFGDGVTREFTGLDIGFKADFYDNKSHTFSQIGWTALFQGNGLEVRQVAVVDQSVPEPGMLALVGLGLAGLAVARRRQS